MSVDSSAQRADEGETHEGASSPAGESTGGSVPVSTVVLFLVGCVVMVLAAASITNLSDWAQRWGQVVVFLTFFIVVALGGRWFFGGIDAFIAAAREGKN